MISALRGVLAVLVGAGVGYWVDRRWQTTPYGVIVGLVIGFAAMVLRLLRMGRELDVGGDDGSGSAVGSDAGESGAARVDPPAAGDAAEAEADRGPAETPALSDVWREDGSDERKKD